MDKEVDLGFLPDRSFNPSLYPKEYKFSVFEKLVSSILPIGILSIITYAIVNSKQINKIGIFTGIFILFLWYFGKLRFVFGYRVVLYSDRIEINRFLNKKTVIPRRDILYYSLGGFCRNTAIELVTKRNEFYIDTTVIDQYVVTHGEFERDRDFYDWFNTLDVKKVPLFPVPKLRDKVK